MSLSKLAALKLKATQAIVPTNKPLELVNEKTTEIPGTSIISNNSGSSDSSSESTGNRDGNSITTSAITSEVRISSPSPSSYLSLPDSGEVSFEHLDFLSKMGELESALLSAHPSMPVLLREIHNHLKEDPEIVTLLSENAIGIIVNGLKVQTKTELSGSTAKALEKKGKKVALSLDMF